MTTSRQSAADQPMPQPGDRWRHYKTTHDGKEYVVTIIGIATYSTRYWNIPEKVVLYAADPVAVIHQLATELTFVVQHTESKTLFAIAVNNTGDYILTPASSLTATVRTPTARAQPLSNFLEMLGAKDEGTYFYRFEKVQ